MISEEHSSAFTAFYNEHRSSRWASSTLLKVELLRTARRISRLAVVNATELVSSIDLVRIDDRIVDAAAAQPLPVLRVLDAIHLATARVLSAELEGLATYDHRLSEAAQAAGLSVVTPSD